MPNVSLVLNVSVHHTSEFFVLHLLHADRIQLADVLGLRSSLVLFVEQIADPIGSILVADTYWRTYVLGGDQVISFHAFDALRFYEV